VTRTENNILLFSITLCWAASYVFIASLPPDLSTFAYITMTTGIAAIVLSIIFFRQLRKVNRGTVKAAFFLSMVLTVGLMMERWGVNMLSASDASFLAALTILIVPALMLLLRKKPTVNNMVGAGVILLGLFMASRFSLSAFANSGTLFMLAACLFSSIYIILADRFTKETDPLLLGVMLMIFVTLFGFILWTIEEPTTFFSITYTNELLSSIFILAFFSKAYAYIVLMFSQKYSDPVSVTIIASTEPVVTLTLAVMIPAAYGAGEEMTFASLGGALVIAAGAVIAGTSFFNRKKAKSHGS